MWYLAIVLEVSRKEAPSRRTTTRKMYLVEKFLIKEVCRVLNVHDGERRVVL